MNNKIKPDAASANLKQWRRILLPSSQAYADCVQAFEKRFATNVPAFPHRCLAIESQGTLFVRVRSSNIPMLIQEGYADAGVVFSDVAEEYNDSVNLNYEQLDGSLLYFCLLIPYEKEVAIRRRLHSSTELPLAVATAYPVFLKRTLEKLEAEGTKLNVRLVDLPLQGAIEAMCALGVADVVADVVKTGTSAKTNELAVVHLSDIRPTLIFRKADS